MLHHNEMNSVQCVLGGWFVFSSSVCEMMIRSHELIVCGCFLVSLCECADGYLILWWRKYYVRRKLCFYLFIFLPPVPLLQARVRNVLSVVSARLRCVNYVFLCDEVLRFVFISALKIAAVTDRVYWGRCYCFVLVRMSLMNGACTVEL